MDINSKEVDTLAKLFGEAVRAKPKAVSRFVEPARGTLENAKSQQHHIIFGRRGSGKSSLLRKTFNDLSAERKPVAFVDMETFKGHEYPDVLLSVLIATMQKFKEWVVSYGSAPSNKLSFWDKILMKPKVPPLKQEARKKILDSLSRITLDLEKLLHTEDNTHTETLQKVSEKSSSMVSGTVGVEIDAQVAKAKVKDSVNAKDEVDHSIELKQNTIKRKIDYLLRHILEFQQLFSGIAELNNNCAYLILDDLYHIKREDQASVLDYFHRIVKNTGVWMKIGTIRHRTEHYRHTTPPVGMQLNEDADQIDLDLTLEKYELTKKFLSKILYGFLVEAHIPNQTDIILDSAVDRLVLASGGVARDFIGIFRRAIECAREKDEVRIGAEEVNRAAGENDTSKREEMNFDAADDKVSLDNVFRNICTFCFTAKVNCFLLERDKRTALQSFVDQLVDLKMLHLVSSRVTVPDPERRGKLFIAYMLDLSQYAGERKRRGLQMLEFWNKGERDQLRKARLIYETLE